MITVEVAELVHEVINAVDLEHSQDRAHAVKGVAHTIEQLSLFVDLIAFVADQGHVVGIGDAVAILVDAAAVGIDRLVELVEVVTVFVDQVTRFTDRDLSQSQKLAPAVDHPAALVQELAALVNAPEAGKGLDLVHPQISEARGPVADTDIVAGRGKHQPAVALGSGNHVEVAAAQGRVDIGDHAAGGRQRYRQRGRAYHVAGGRIEDIEIEDDRAIREPGRRQQPLTAYFRVLHQFVPFLVNQGDVDGIAILVIGGVDIDYACTQFGKSVITHEVGGIALYIHDHPALFVSLQQETVLVDGPAELIDDELVFSRGSLVYGGEGQGLGFIEKLGDTHGDVGNGKGVGTVHNQLVPCLDQAAHFQ